MDRTDTQLAETQAPAKIGTTAAPAFLERVPQSIIPLLLCALMFLQLAATIRQLSRTADEPEHIHAGFRVLHCGDYGFSSEHPPLARIVAALPLQFVQVNDPDGCTADVVRGRALRFFYSNEPSRMLRATRLAATLFPLALCFVVWLTARQMFGAEAAFVAAGLICFEPNLVGHGSLVTTDVAVCVTLLLTVLAFYLWLSRRSFNYLLLVGLATGLALTSKMSGIVVLAVLGLLAVVVPQLEPMPWEERIRKFFRNLLAVVGVCVIAAVVIWTVYGFRFAARPAGAAIPTITPVGIKGSVISFIAAAHLLPQSYLQGLMLTFGMTTDTGRPMFLLGHLYPTGHWFYFPVALLIKLTIPVLALTLIAVIARPFKSYRREALFLILPALVFQLSAMQSKLNIGVRHVLPVVPFLAIIAAAAWVYIVRKLPHRWLLLILPVALQALTSLHAAPNYISYANEFWGGPSATYRYLSDSNSDWGQALNQAAEYARHNTIDECWAAPYPFSVPADYAQLPCGVFGLFPAQLPRHVHGTVIVSSIYLSGGLREFGFPPFTTFDKLAPSDYIGGSAMLVYKGDLDMRVPSGVGEVLLARNAATREQWPEALTHADAAVQLVPELAVSHAEQCKAAAVVGQRDRAITACETALRLFRADPFQRRLEIDQTRRTLALLQSSEE